MGEFPLPAVIEQCEIMPGANKDDILEQLSLYLFYKQMFT